MWQRMILSVAVALTAALAGCAAAPRGTLSNAPADEAAPGLSLTIYSSADPGTFDPLAAMRVENSDNSYMDLRVPGYGVVRDTRKFSLRPGPNALTFTEVAAGIDPTTASLRTLDALPELSVLEQNFRFDLFASDKLLKKYLGKRVTVTMEGKSGSAGTVSGTLLGAKDKDLILRGDDGTVQIIARGDGRWQIGLGGGEGGLITRPTLELVVHADKAGERVAQVTYQTDNLTWRADYSLLLNKDDTAGDLSTWVTLVNQSGAGYPGTQLKLIAGDVRRFTHAVPVADSGGGGGGGGAAAAFVENPFFEYHMYTLGRTVDLPDNSIKQVELIAPRRGVAVEKVYVFDSMLAGRDGGGGGSDGVFTGHQQDGSAPGKVDVCVRIKNTEANHLGVPLPAGRVRVYKKDAADGAAEFVGEDVIDHTPRDETVMVVIGKSFDIVGNRAVTHVEQAPGGRILAETIEVVLRNHKSEPVRVVIRESPNGWWWSGGWRVTECTEKYEVPNVHVLLIPVDLPKDGEKKVTFTVRYDGK